MYRLQFERRNCLKEKKEVAAYNAMKKHESLSIVQPVRITVEDPTH